MENERIVNGPGVKRFCPPSGGMHLFGCASRLTEPRDWRKQWRMFPPTITDIAKLNSVSGGGTKTGSEPRASAEFILMFIFD